MGLGPPGVGGIRFGKILRALGGIRLQKMGIRLGVGGIRLGVGGIRLVAWGYTLERWGYTLGRLDLGLTRHCYRGRLRPWAPRGNQIWAIFDKI